MEDSPLNRARLFAGGKKLWNTGNFHGWFSKYNYSYEEFEQRDPIGWDEFMYIVEEILNASDATISEFRDSNDLESQATKIANSEPWSYHADSCPYLISNGKRNCRCNCYSSALNKLYEEHKKSLD